MSYINKIRSNKHLSIAAAIIGIILFFSACSSSTSTSTKNVASIYLPGVPTINPSYKIFHQTDSISSVYFSFDAKNLLYTKKLSDTLFSSELQLKYALYDISKKHLLDSASHVFYDEKNVPPQSEKLEGELQIPINIGQHYFLNITATDINRKQHITKSFAVKKTTKPSKQYYLFTDTLDNILFLNNFVPGSRIKIKQSPVIRSLSTSITVFPSIQEIALPPFLVTKDTLPKSTPIFDTTIYFNNNTAFLPIKYQGIYSFYEQKNQTQPNYSVYCFSESFPKVTEIHEMLPPLRYISTKNEFIQVTQNTNIRDAFEQFWIALAGNKDRAKRMIRTYYTRVERSNQYFSSHKEGWKTDRGMIFLVFGPPRVVQKNDNYESWTYGDNNYSNNMLSTNFLFKRRNNPISTNDFILQRTINYRSNWYKAVDAWRNGRIY